MTAFDDDPEYEAQLKDVLGDRPWQQDGQDEEMGEFKGDDAMSEDSVLDDAPTFRMKLPGDGSTTVAPTNDDVSEFGGGDDRPLSEDGRSISTGDDSPSVPVRSLGGLTVGL
jgi:hypothetical protein